MKFESLSAWRQFSVEEPQSPANFIRNKSEPRLMPITPKTGSLFHAETQKGTSSEQRGAYELSTIERPAPALASSARPSWSHPRQQIDLMGGREIRPLSETSKARA